VGSSSLVGEWGAEWMGLPPCFKRATAIAGDSGW